MAGLKLGFSAIRELGKAIAGTTETRQQTKKAIVREVTDGGAVVEVAGSGVLTPVESSAATYGVGDVVTVSNRGGKLHIDGDVSAPSVGAGYVRKTVQPVAQAVAEAAQTAAEGVKAGADAQKAADEAKATANATDQHFWTDAIGVHVTEQTQEDWQTAQTGGNILINSLGLLLRTALNNLVSITKSAIAFYDGAGNSASNIVARFGADGAQVGVADGLHTVIDEDSFDLFTDEAESNSIFHVGYPTGATVTDTFVGDDSTTGYTLNNTPSGTVSVTIDGTATSAWVLSGTTLTMDTAPADGAVLEVSYPTAAYIPYYTLGARSGNAGEYSVAEGRQTTASGNNSHAEGGGTTASGADSHAEGAITTASGWFSHAEGAITTASGWYSHAEGSGTTASGADSHAEGRGTTASGTDSHAEGRQTTASGLYSHAQNIGTVSARDAQTAIGTFNSEDTATTTTHPSGDGGYGEYALVIGNGTGDDNRSNALAVDWTGDVTRGVQFMERRLSANSTVSMSSTYSYTNVPLNTTAASSGTKLEASGNGIKVKEAGYYLISAGLVANAPYYGRVYAGSDTMLTGTSNQAAHVGGGMGVTARYLAANTTIYLKICKTGTTNPTVAGSEMTFLSVIKIG